MVFVSKEESIEIYGKDVSICDLPSKVNIKGDGIKNYKITSQYAKQGYNKWNSERNKKGGVLEEEFYYCIPCEMTMSKTGYNLHMKSKHKNETFIDKYTGKQLNKY